jgi:hypothetical protein
MTGRMPSDPLALVVMLSEVRRPLESAVPEADSLSQEGPTPFEKQYCKKSEGLFEIVNRTDRLLKYITVLLKLLTTALGYDAITSACQISSILAYMIHCVRGASVYPCFLLSIMRDPGYQVMALYIIIRPDA